jgi:hypothetical protein
LRSIAAVGAGDRPVTECQQIFAQRDVQLTGRRIVETLHSKL